MPSGSHSSYKPSSNRRSAGYVGSSYVPGGSGYSNPYLQGVNNPAQQLQTQQIYIPNDLVGCIIGKGGSKINEIRHMSASQIKIMEPGAGPVGSAPGGSEGERLVVITGPPANIQMAVQLLYHVCYSPALVSRTSLKYHGLSPALGAGETEASPCSGWFSPIGFRHSSFKAKTKSYFFSFSQSVFFPSRFTWPLSFPSFPAPPLICLATS
jgi:hypothetical protein